MKTVTDFSLSIGCRAKDNVRWHTSDGLCVPSDKIPMLLKLHLDWLNWMALLSAVFFMLSTLTGCSNANGLPSTGSHAPPKKGVVNLSQPLQDELHIKTEVLRKQLLATSLHVPGQIHPEFGKEVSLTTRVNGRVTKILVVPGQQVKAGQVIAVIDSQQISELEAELIESKAKVNIARAQEERERQIYEEQLKRPKTLVEAKAQFDEAKVQLELTEREFKRAEELYKERIAAGKDFYKAQANHLKAQAVYRQVLSDLQREERLFKNKAMMKRDYQLAQAETGRAEQHFNTLKQRLIFLGMTPAMVNRVVLTQNIAGTVPVIAPIIGIITGQDVALGEIVDPGKQAFRISDLSTVAVSADISEVDLSYVTIGTKVRAKVSGYPDTIFAGTVSYISSHVNPETRTVSIRARLLNPDMKLKAGMFAEIDVELSPHLVLACPKSAVLERDAHKIVYLATSQGFEERRIKVGKSNEKYCEVISGLTEGDRVVTSGSLLLKAELGR